MSIRKFLIKILQTKEEIAQNEVNKEKAEEYDKLKLTLNPFDQFLRSEENNKMLQDYGQTFTEIQRYKVKIKALEEELIAVKETYKFSEEMWHDINLICDLTTDAKYAEREAVIEEIRQLLMEGRRRGAMRAVVELQNIKQQRSHHNHVSAFLLSQEISKNGACINFH